MQPNNVIQDVNIERDQQKEPNEKTKEKVTREAEGIKNGDDDFGSECHLGCKDEKCE